VPQEAARQRTRRSRDDVRQELLEAALVEFGANGFDGASTRAIAERADAHQPQINYHFASKTALWHEAVDHLFALLDAELGPLVLDLGAPASELAASFAEIVHRFVRFAAAHPELNQIVVHESTAPSDRLSWMVARHVQPRYDGLRALWRVLRRHGLAAPIDDALVHYVLVGAASLPFVSRYEAEVLLGEDPTSPDVVRRHADGIVRMLLPGHGSS
jgi:TetR/AcrR family transcriptional regulator